MPTILTANQKRLLALLQDAPKGAGINDSKMPKQDREDFPNLARAGYAFCDIYLWKATASGKRVKL